MERDGYRQPNEQSSSTRSILVVDSDPSVLRSLRESFSEWGFSVKTATEETSAMSKIATDNPDLVIFDNQTLSQDRLNGKSNGCRIPNIVISNTHDCEIGIQALEKGADHFQVKPLDQRLLVALVRAILTRVNQERLQVEDLIRIAGIEINVRSFTIKRDDQELTMRRKSKELFMYLAQNRGKVLTREKLLDEIWGSDSIVYPRSVDETVSEIRRVLGENRENGLIRTVWGIGYMLRDSGNNEIGNA